MLLQCLNNAILNKTEAAKMAAKSNHRQTHDNCVAGDEKFRTSAIAVVPSLLGHFEHLCKFTVTNDKHWSDRIVDALADGYSTVAQMHELLRRDYRTFDLRETLLIFHWLFRNFAICNGNQTLEYQMRRMQQNDRITSNSIKYIHNYYALNCN